MPSLHLLSLQPIDVKPDKSTVEPRKGQPVRRGRLPGPSPTEVRTQYPDKTSTNNRGGQSTALKLEAPFADWVQHIRFTKKDNRKYHTFTHKNGLSVHGWAGTNGVLAKEKKTKEQYPRPPYAKDDTGPSSAEGASRGVRASQSNSRGPLLVQYERGSTLDQSGSTDSITGDGEATASASLSRLVQKADERESLSDDSDDLGMISDPEDPYDRLVQRQPSDPVADGVQSSRDNTSSNPAASSGDGEENNEPPATEPASPNRPVQVAGGVQSPRDDTSSDPGASSGPGASSDPAESGWESRDGSLDSFLEVFD